MSAAGPQSADIFLGRETIATCCTWQINMFL